ncbi:MAG: hypothetical protein U1F43_38985 [Myxococcota bacterium]
MRVLVPRWQDGDGPTLAVRAANDPQRTFVRFDLGALPPGAVVARATLRLWRCRRSARPARSTCAR